MSGEAAVTRATRAGAEEVEWAGGSGAPGDQLGRESSEIWGSVRHALAAVTARSCGAAHVDCLPPLFTAEAVREGVQVAEALDIPQQRLVKRPQLLLQRRRGGGAAQTRDRRHPLLSGDVAHARRTHSPGHHEERDVAGLNTHVHTSREAAGARQNAQPHSQALDALRSDGVRVVPVLRVAVEQCLVRRRVAHRRLGRTAREGAHRARAGWVRAARLPPSPAAMRGAYNNRNSPYPRVGRERVGASAKRAAWSSSAAPCSRSSRVRVTWTARSPRAATD
eukprot:scaffold27_cov125-Isochrysis_galbana.AAC.10